MAELPYKRSLEATKEFYPFSEWEKDSIPDSEDKEGDVKPQHSPENCKKAQAVFDKLINDLIHLGESAREDSKIELFRVAVIKLNELNEGIHNFILTGEREDLCALFDQITLATGLVPENFSDGGGITDEWREW